MSISVVINNDLWGLIACHGYGDVGIRVTLPMRELARNIGECAATNIQRLLMMERIEARKAPKNVSPTQNPAAFIAASSSDLLRAFSADFGLLNVQNEARAIGKLDPYREALAILAHLQTQEFKTVYSTQNVNAAFPAIKYPIHNIAGLLIIPLTMGAKDFLVFFKKGQLREVQWAGNPYEKTTQPGSEYLEPRMSFSRWSETVMGMSKEWTEDNLETALVLSFLYGRFIQIWREKESTGKNNRMTRLLIQNSSHEVRTPLNAIINYLEIALETPLEEQTREILNKAHEASKSLIYVLDDLLNLTKAQDGSHYRFSSEENFDLTETVSDVITAFRKEAARKEMDLVFLAHPGIPERVRGEASRLRQVLSNITSNAFQHSLAGGIKIEIRLLSTNVKDCVVAIAIQDVGVGMTESQLDVSHFVVSSCAFHSRTPN
jgi:light-regulated signal transduction histidine kinase (bacteriophytochrome)